MTSATEEQPETEARNATVLTLTGVTKTYPGVKALTDVSLDVRSGEVHAIVGENGAGKSTLIGVAAGSVAADAGKVEVNGNLLSGADAKEAQSAGLAVVYQHPALLPDLTVAENLLLVVPRDERPSRRNLREWVDQKLSRIGARLDPLQRVGELTVEERHLLEIAKALALRPSVLVLDEPTEPLVSDEVERLFTVISELTATGTAVIYISHRIPDVMRIADRITVLRDGVMRGTFEAGAVTEHEILERIVGRALESTFPAKPAAASLGPDVLDVQALSGDGFSHVDLQVRRGEIVGLAGVSGNGQREFLRGLAGLARVEGDVRLNGTSTRLDSVPAAAAAGIAYCPGDRHDDGMFTSLSVRENLLVRALSSVSFGGVVRRRMEGEAAVEEIRRLRIKTPSTETPIASLSGGNQQKIMIARTLLAHPRLLLIEEPTQGVDVGARAEIYKILREAAESGVAVVVLSSDAKELEGLCDRVAVFARGQVTALLAGDEVTESTITGAAVMAETELERKSALGKTSGRGRRFLTGDFFPVSMVVLALLALAAYTASVDSLFLSSFNISSLLLLATTLVLAAAGQQVVMLTGGIDVSIGAALGFLVVVGSFVLTGNGIGSVLLGVGVVLVASCCIGLVHGVAVCFGGFTPIVATLATLFLLQGLALLMRPNPEGFVSADLALWVGRSYGPVPMVFIIAVALVLATEYMLRRSRFGMSLRAVGSDEQSAQRIGIDVRRIRMTAYLLCALFVGAAGVVFFVQSGIGDATAGASYTLTSITAVVIGGASAFGARGSFLGALAGALLIQTIVNSTLFLGLEPAWQQYFIGGITIVAAGVYSKVRRAAGG
ncbi:ATP-binding cassette domain-containing protein [Nocardioides cavernae]|uniref:ATP-binding cassette domain-containing protein n=1 Tax=Nocardioides cavernae TaxID=1921566 RepID=A0ABR8N9E3_9ACTN|nr:ATP-binding cassette domain-containing protein [Nocardioides cavernae]MBD3924211.1 ATP-binding cassette domain-containing protein [Nocardioides cavernae]MBM7510851.1 ribose transport system ATP-binding protein [Nocardioides cavernae]